jgi:hypothetical protein
MKRLQAYQFETQPNGAQHAPRGVAAGPTLRLIFCIINLRKKPCKIGRYYVAPVEALSIQGGRAHCVQHAAAQLPSVRCTRPPAPPLLRKSVMTNHELALPTDYGDWLASLKQRIAGAQQRAVRAVNRELLLLYWQIGHDILQRQHAQGWDAKVIDRLGHDLRIAFPAMKGLSPCNLKYMRTFATGHNP